MSASESHSAVVLQLAEEFLERYRQGERPSLKEYIERHPELAAEIKEVFPAMALMENVALADESLDGAATGPATPAESIPPQQLGDYRILREVGRGGMGIVYEAEQVSLGRHVALKVLPRQLFVEDSRRRRFEREAKAAAKLHHTNIVPVFGVGEHDGLPYYVMQFIQGLGLDDVLEELKRIHGSGTATAAGGELRVARRDVSAADVARSLLTGAFESGAGGVSPPSESQGAYAPRSAESSTTGKLSDSFTLSSAVRLPGSGDAMHGKGKKATYWQSVAQIGEQVAQALEYAHKQGIQHRDIKPSNLLLDTHGTVWVTDLGLARADNEDHLTQTGDIVGTLRYMPPEAFEGRADKRGDIYSLGLTLYEMLALKPAYQERDRHRLIKRVTTEEPAHLDTLNRSIPRDLVTIVHKTIDREPTRRYQSADELAADLQRFLDDEPIQARRISNGERLWRWCRHHPGVATLTAALAVLLLSVSFASMFAANYQAGLRQQADEAKKQAETNLQEADRQKQQAEANFAKARQAVDDSFTKVSESQLLKVPGMQPLRRDLLRSALTFYQDFVRERGEDPPLRGELAAAYLRVAWIYWELGNETEERKSWEQARDLYELLLKSAPDSIEWQHGLAQCYTHLDRLDDAIGLWQKLVRREPRFQRELGDAYNSRGVVHSKADRPAEAVQDYERSLTIREMLVRLNPDDPKAQHDLGGTLNNFGALLAGKGRTADALVMFRRAAENHEAAFALAPQVLQNGISLVDSQYNVAMSERHLRHQVEALAAFRRAVGVRLKLVRDNPAIPKLHTNLFQAYLNLARYQAELNQIEQGKQTIRLAREAIERMPSDAPEELFNLACCRVDRTASVLQDKQTDAEQAEQEQEADLAMEALRKAIAAGFRDVERFHKTFEESTLRSREDFKALEADLAARVAASSPDRLTTKEQATSLNPKLVPADPKNRRLQADSAASYHAIALLLLDLGQVDTAQNHLDQAAALREALVKDEPKNARYQADLAASRFYLHLIRARRFAEQKRNDEAEAVLAKIEAHPSDEAQAYKELGRIRFVLGHTDKATTFFRKTVESLPDEVLEELALASEPVASVGDKLLAALAYDSRLRKLTAAIERGPEDKEARWTRGVWYAHQARWKEAAADFRIGFEARVARELRDPQKAMLYLDVAPVLAISDREEYRWLCREALKHFGDTKDPTTADRIAKVCLLLPDIAKEMERAYQLADLAVAGGKNHEFSLWFIFCKGLADYRRGKFREAIEGLESVVSKVGDRTPEWSISSGNWVLGTKSQPVWSDTSGSWGWATESQLVLAMAFFRQGNEKAAREYLTRAEKLLGKYLLDPVRLPIPKKSSYNHDWLMAWLLPTPAGVGSTMLSGYDNDWLIVWLLHREAHSLIEGDKAGPNK